jgi:hypothetical protein
MEMGDVLPRTSCKPCSYKLEKRWADGSPADESPFWRWRGALCVTRRPRPGRAGQRCLAASGASPMGMEARRGGVSSENAAVYSGPVAGDLG